jgi:hypothetical protein
MSTGLRRDDYPTLMGVIGWKDGVASSKFETCWHKVPPLEFGTRAVLGCGRADWECADLSCWTGSLGGILLCQSVAVTNVVA